MMLVSLLTTTRHVAYGGTTVVICGRDVGQGGEKTGEGRKESVLMRKGKPGKTSNCVYPRTGPLEGEGKVCLQLLLIYAGPVERFCPYGPFSSFISSRRSSASIPTCVPTPDHATYFPLVFDWDRSPAIMTSSFCFCFDYFLLFVFGYH